MLPRVPCSLINTYKKRVLSEWSDRFRSIAQVIACFILSRSIRMESNDFRDVKCFGTCWVQRVRSDCIRYECSVLPPCSCSRGQHFFVKFCRYSSIFSRRSRIINPRKLHKPTCSSEEANDCFVIMNLHEHSLCVGKRHLERRALGFYA